MMVSARYFRFGPGMAFAETGAEVLCIAMRESKNEFKRSKITVGNWYTVTHMNSGHGLAYIRCINDVGKSAIYSAKWFRFEEGVSREMGGDQVFICNICGERTVASIAIPEIAMLSDLELEQSLAQISMAPPRPQIRTPSCGPCASREREAANRRSQSLDQAINAFQGLGSALAGMTGQKDSRPLPADPRPHTPGKRKIQI